MVSDSVVDERTRCGMDLAAVLVPKKNRGWQPSPGKAAQFAPVPN